MSDRATPSAPASPRPSAGMQAPRLGEVEFLPHWYPRLRRRRRILFRAALAAALALALALCLSYARP